MKSISVRFPDELRDRVREAAAADRRSFNSEVLALVEQALDMRGGGAGQSTSQG